MQTLKHDEPSSYRQIQTLQSSYLSQHFLQMSSILSKHYRFAFSLLANLHSLHPSPARETPIQLLKTIQRITIAKKRSYFDSLLRFIRHKGFQKATACFKMVQILYGKTTLLLVQGFLRITSRGSVKAIVSKDKALFLIICLSNLNKMVATVKCRALEAMKAEARRRTLLINKGKALALRQALTLQMNNYLRWGFNNIACLQPQQYPQSQQLHSQSSYSESDEEQQQILSECYKNMAFNLQKLQRSPHRFERPYQAIRQTGTAIFCRCLNRCISRVLGNAILDMMGGAGRLQTLNILRRQIAILQRQYQSV